MKEIKKEIFVNTKFCLHETILKLRKNIYRNVQTPAECSRKNWKKKLKEAWKNLKYGGEGGGRTEKGGGIQSVNTLPVPKKNLNQTAAEETWKNLK